MSVQDTVCSCTRYTGGSGSQSYHPIGSSRSEHGLSQLPRRSRWPEDDEDRAEFQHCSRRIRPECGQMRSSLNPAQEPGVASWPGEAMRRGWPMLDTDSRKGKRMKSVLLPMISDANQAERVYLDSDPGWRWKCIPVPKSRRFGLRYIARGQSLAHSVPSDPSRLASLSNNEFRVSCRSLCHHEGMDRFPGPEGQRGHFQRTRPGPS